MHFGLWKSFENQSAFLINGGILFMIDVNARVGNYLIDGFKDVEIEKSGNL